ncbi:VOC family protein [Actinomycetes bacterium KLBMP 9797]
MDAADPVALGRFWARMLDADLVELPDGDTRIDPRTGRGAESIWVNRVPEPRVGRTRVRLDVHATAPGVHADPEGNEFRALPGPAGAAALEVDAADPAAQAAWWAGVVGGEVELDRTQARLVGAAGFPWAAWIFVPEAAPRTVKNRWHWDVDLAGADPSALVAAGATMVRERGADLSWWVLTDPEGNEFCAFVP